MRDNKSTISQMVLEKIKKDEVKPIPKWHFVLKYGFLWLIIIIFLICASAALGVSYFEITDIDWEVPSFLGMGILNYFFFVLPYFWVLLFLAIGVLAYYNFLATPKGYKFPRYQIVTFGVLILVMVAAAFHYFGTSQMIRDTIRDNIPGFHRLMHNKEEVWNRPDEGLLAGKINEVQNNGVVVVTFDHTKWQVDTTNTDIPDGKELSVGQMIRIVGEKTGDNQFVAQSIKPWKKDGGLQFGPPPTQNNDDFGPPPPAENNGSQTKY
ncbi:MAG TPA: hypothetical protein PLZ62_02275 [bacterium]|nr:hypothetical protein [bacterium]